jgi:hypothetical protein
MEDKRRTDLAKESLHGMVCERDRDAIINLREKQGQEGEVQ